MATPLQLRRGLAANLPTLGNGEPAWTTDTHTLYVGQSGVNYAVGGGTTVVTNGGTGRTTLDAGQLLAGNGTSAIDSLSDTRVSGEKIELKIDTDRWLAFSKGSF